MNEQKGLFAQLGETLDRYVAERRVMATENMSLRQPGRLSSILRRFVPNSGTLLLVSVLILTAKVWAKPLISPAAAPGPSATTVNYQGRLADPSGDPKNGTFGMTFALYDASTGGSLVWGPESHAAVPVSDGLFSVGLGSQTSGGIPTSAWNGDRYLEITVGGETLSPRELIRSVPIAGMALTVPDGAITANMIADDAISRIIRVEPSTPSVSYNSTIWAALPEMATTFTTEESNVLVLFSGTFLNDIPGGGGAVCVEVDGQRYESSVTFGHSGSSDDVFTLMINSGFELEPGTHTIKVLWRRQSTSAGGNIVAQGLRRQLTIVELKR